MQLAVGLVAKLAGFYAVSDVSPGKRVERTHGATGQVSDRSLLARPRVMTHEQYDPALREMACRAARNLPRYVRLLTSMLRRLPTDRELATLWLRVHVDISSSRDIDGFDR